MEQYCECCDIKGYCDKIPDDCPLAKEYKQIEEFENAKEQLKNELIKSFEKYFNWFEDKIKSINRRLKG